MDEQRCEKSDLPTSMCAHCTGKEAEFPDMDEVMIKVTGHGTVRRIPGTCATKTTVESQVKVSDRKVRIA